jgi:hypothetical protein
MYHAISYPRAFYPRDHNEFGHYVIRTPAIPTPRNLYGSFSLDKQVWMIDVSTILIKQGITYFISKQYVKKHPDPINSVKLNDRPYRHDSPYTWGVSPSAACLCFSHKPLHKFPKAYS